MPGRVLLAEARVLPPRVALFRARARRLALRRGDEFTLASATSAREVGELLKVARGARHVVELGTGTAWTAIALALADRRRRVVTYDSVARPERDLYLQLAGRPARGRIVLVDQPAGAGPRPGTPAPDFVFLDSSHERAETTETFAIWRAALAPGGAIAFHDYADPRYPGVTEAIRELGLRGEERGHLFLWRAG
jgi:predicted O-methyltransferase YrrM